MTSRKPTQVSPIDCTLDTIKAWRKKMFDAGQPSSLRDFFKCNNICPSCRGNLLKLSLNGLAVEPCDRCNGDGSWHEVV